MASLIPAFQIGLWNGWLFMVYLILLAYVPVLTGLVGKEAYEKLGDSEASLSPREKRLSSAGNILLLASIAYGVFLPMEPGTAWFYAGLAAFLAGAALATLAMRDFARAPAGRPVTGGVYRFSRNPMYVGMLLIYFATALACASWVFLALTLINALLLREMVAAEERFLAGKYGRAYRDYLESTHRWLGPPRKKQP